VPAAGVIPYFTDRDVSNDPRGAMDVTGTILTGLEHT
jgi:hypothetical protein